MTMLRKPLEKEMATHSSILAWSISWTEEPGGLQYRGSQRVGHDWATWHKKALWMLWMDTVTQTLTGPCTLTRVSLVSQTVKRLPAMQGTWIPSLGREDALEKEMATHSSILAWKIPITSIQEKKKRASEWNECTVKSLLSRPTLLVPEKINM